MAGKYYVHYGCKASGYSPDKFGRIKNIPISTKPAGGFWASPTGIAADGLFDWKDFCRRDDYKPKSGLHQSFFFRLDADAHIFTIESERDYSCLPKIAFTGESLLENAEFIDFEKCIGQGIDAIEYRYSIVHKEGHLGDEMDFKMLGWDCDSILIMNQGVILRESFSDDIAEDYLVKGV